MVGFNTTVNSYGNCLVSLFLFSKFQSVLPCLDILISHSNSEGTWFAQRCFVLSPSSVSLPQLIKLSIIPTYPHIIRTINHPSSPVDQRWRPFYRIICIAQNCLSKIVKAMWPVMVVMVVEPNLSSIPSVLHDFTDWCQAVKLMEPID